MGLVLEAAQSPERDTPEYLDVDHSKMTATFVRVPGLADVPYAVQMEPNLVIEFYARTDLREDGRKAGRGGRIRRGACFSAWRGRLSVTDIRPAILAASIWLGLAGAGAAQTPEPDAPDAPPTEFDKLVNRSDGMFVDRGDGAFRLSDDARFIQSKPPSEEGRSERDDRAGQSPSLGARRDLGRVFDRGLDER
jgi:hypothetical protein